MPLPRLPFPSFYTGGHYSGRSIVDPKEFWANCLYLARMINGGLGVENVVRSAGISPSHLERPYSSMMIYLDLDSAKGFAAAEPLIKIPMECYLVGFTLQISRGVDAFAGTFKAGADIIDSIVSTTYGVSNYVNKSPQIRHIAAATELTMTVSIGSCRAMTLELIAGHST